MNCKAKKIDNKLFLISRDIQIGDKVICIRGSSGKGDIGMSGLTYDTSYLIVGQEYEIWGRHGAYYDIYSDDGPMSFTSDHFNNFKVIGEISPEAIWVKEGDEFELRDFNPLAQAGIEHNQPTRIIRIKCPICNTFHINLIKQ